MRRFVVTAATLAAVLIPATQAHAAYPVETSFARALTAGLKNPGAMPPGTNDWDCKLTAEHPRPIILVHATALPPSVNWMGLGPFLANEGFCVFTPVYGRVHGWPGMGRYEDSAADLGRSVDRVLANYPGLDKVDLAGHSQGGAMPRWYIKFLGGTETVHRQISIAGPNKDGTDFLGIMKLIKRWKALGLVRFVGVAFEQQVYGSALMRTLNAGDRTPGDVKYDMISSRYDEILTPYTNGFLDDANSNWTVQTGCSIDFSDHTQIVYSRRVMTKVANLLDDGNRKLPCRLEIPLGVR
ncbi:MAG: lipase [Solirubrobacteraceae bacterium]|nr:lipase [Solirubrobacteraceae bacterium]